MTYSYSAILLLSVGLLYVTTNNEALHLCSNNEDCTFQAVMVNSDQCCIKHVCRDCNILKIQLSRFKRNVSEDQNESKTNETHGQCVENWSDPLMFVY